MLTRLVATAVAVLLLATTTQAQNVKTFPPTKPYVPPKQPVFVPPVHKVPVSKPPVFYPPVYFPPVYCPPVYVPTFPVYRPPYFPSYPGYPWYGW